MKLLMASGNMCLRSEPTPRQLLHHGLMEHAMMACMSIGTCKHADETLTQSPLQG